MVGKCMLAVGGRPPFLPMGTSPQGHLSVLTTWQLASSRATDAREQGGSYNVFYDIASEVIFTVMLSFLKYPIGCTDLPCLVWEATKERHEYQEAGILGAILEAGYHMPLIGKECASPFSLSLFPLPGMINKLPFCGLRVCE